MKSCVNVCRLKQFLILTAALVIMLETAYAQESVKKSHGLAQAGNKENVAVRASHVKSVNPEPENKDKELLNELLQTDAAIMTELTAKEAPCENNECSLEKPR